MCQIGVGCAFRIQSPQNSEKTPFLIDHERCGAQLYLNSRRQALESYIWSDGDLTQSSLSTSAAGQTLRVYYQVDQSRIEENHCAKQCRMAKCRYHVIRLSRQARLIPKHGGCLVRSSHDYQIGRIHRNTGFICNAKRKNTQSGSFFKSYKRKIAFN